MIPVNPGNLLPFYTTGYSAEDRRYQRHRLPGQDSVPFGLRAPRTRLLPFQVYFSGAAGDITIWQLINVDDSTFITLDSSLLEVDVLSDESGFWVTWKAAENLDTIPDCGFWYFALTVDGQDTVYSEVMHAVSMCGLEVAGLEIRNGSCNESGGTLGFSIDAVLYTTPGTTYTIQRYTGSAWITLSTNGSTAIAETASAETKQYRIVATTVCGVILTTTYTATWTAGDACNTLTLGSGSTVTTDVSILDAPQVWRLSFAHSRDKGNVLYQTGYKQYLYLDIPVWDAPEIQREEELQENGNGVITMHSSRTRVRTGFEFSDLPDYLLPFLAKCADLNTVRFEDIETSVGFDLSNIVFESRRQGAALHTGRLYFETEQEAFSGCQENFELSD